MTVTDICKLKPFSCNDQTCYRQTGFFLNEGQKQEVLLYGGTFSDGKQKQEDLIMFRHFHCQCFRTL